MQYNQARHAILFGEEQVVNRWQRSLHWRLGKHWIIPALLAMSLITGCAAASYNPYLLPGAGIGAALGAGIGAAANHSNPWRGAAIGGLVGTALGGVAGEAYGRSSPYAGQQQQGYYQQQPPPQQPYYGPPTSYRGPAPGPGYGYNAPPASNNYAYSAPIPEPPTEARTPITPAPYITE
jgi:hypothetical protein